MSVQVEVAWGRPSGAFVGIDADRQDFPFANALGLVLSVPRRLCRAGAGAGDYYARVNAARLPLLVVEGGWTSAVAFGSTPDRQARWIRRQFELATQAQALHVFQLLFTDLDEAAYGQLGGVSLCRSRRSGSSRPSSRPSLRSPSGTPLSPAHAAEGLPIERVVRTGCREEMAMETWKQ